MRRCATAQLPPLPTHSHRFPLPQVAWVPGSFELPVVAKAMAKSGQYDGVVCIGVVVSGRQRPPAAARARHAPGWHLCPAHVPSSAAWHYTHAPDEACPAAPD